MLSFFILRRDVIFFGRVKFPAVHKTSVADPSLLHVYVKKLTFKVSRCVCYRVVCGVKRRGFPVLGLRAVTRVP